MTRTIGVGFIGGGPATQAIHLSVLATMPDRFHVASVVDVNPLVADKVAARCGARASTDVDEIYADPKIEVVVICSPNDFHAEQVIAVCRAGKRLVLCEKPLAVNRAEADDIARVARQTGTHVVVGTMHAYDPAWRAARAVWAEAEETASLVRSSIFLPGNNIFIDQATDQAIPPQGSPPPAGDPTDPGFQAKRLRAALLGLAIHDIPLLREVYPTVGTLQSACLLQPFGYALAMSHQDRLAELVALTPGAWPASWHFHAVGREHELRVSFTPSYVMAGSARAELIAPGERRVFETPQNGYEAMWVHVADFCHDKAAPLISLDTAIQDLGFAMDLADGIGRTLGAAR